MKYYKLVMLLVKIIMLLAPHVQEIENMVDEYKKEK